MADKAAKKVPEDRAATAAEVETAILALSPADWYRLRNFAERREMLLSEKLQGRDLLGEAFERLLRGTRKWDRTKAGFMTFLYGAMRSIAYSWLKEKVKPTEAPLLASSLVIETTRESFPTRWRTFLCLRSMPPACWSTAKRSNGSMPYSPTMMKSG
jgi:DNA-directed RNA polymerase specialized sigma24 family protein